VGKREGGWEGVSERARAWERGRERAAEKAEGAEGEGATNNEIMHRGEVCVALPGEVAVHYLRLSHVRERRRGHGTGNGKGSGMLNAC
jgi:hypothetical protein